MKAEVELVEVGVHLGNLLLYVAQSYNSGFAVTREGVQNAFDKKAKNVYIKIDCKTCTITIYDDGNGASEKEIREKFDNIALSLKINDPEQMGEKGIGNLAAFAIGQTWNLITTDILSRSGLRAYSFDRSELSKGSKLNYKIEAVPFKSVPGAPFPATTMLRIDGVDEGILRQLGDKGTIDQTLREAFYTILSKQKVSLKVSYRNFKGQVSEFSVKAPKFRGTPLEPVEYDTDFGPVTFEFYHSMEPVNDPAILVVHNGNYSLPVSNFFMTKVIPKEFESLYSKGYFEGEIRLGFCQLNADRYAFQHNIEQQAFVRAVSDFSSEILKPLIQQFEASDRQEKLRKIAESVLKRSMQWLNKHPNLIPPNFKALFSKRVNKVEGSDQGDTSPVATPDLSSIHGSTRKKKPLPPNALKVQRVQSSEEDKDKDKAKKPSKPVLELRDGLAIHIVNPENFEGFAWHSRMTSDGIIQMNAMNNLFTEAERRGQSVLTRYMLLLVQKELTCASLIPQEAVAFNNAFEKTFLTYWKASLTE